MDVSYSYPRVQITVPAEWTDDSIITLVGPERDGFAANVVITRVPTEADGWRAQVERELKELKRRAKAYKAIRDELMPHSGVEARRVEHTFVSPDQVPIKQVQLFVAKGGLLFTASASHEQGAFEKERAGIEKILAGLRFE
jgi:hypothetical protein